MSQRLDRRFHKPTQISRHLYCPICIEVFYDATRLFCGHTFCKECITKWVNDHHSCPECREPGDISLAGKDLIAEKIIQDLEVSCPNKLCDWRDRLEKLPKHINACSYGTMPEWLKKAQNFTHQEEDTTANDIFLQDNEHFMQRINEEVPRKSFLERLYTKNLETKQLVDSVFNTQTNIATEKMNDIGSLMQYDDFLQGVEDSEEEKENDDILVNEKFEQPVYKSTEKLEVEEMVQDENSLRIVLDDENDNKENIEKNDFEFDILVRDNGHLDCVHTGNNENQKSESEIGQNNYRNILMEVNGAHKKRVHKRKRGNEPVEEEDKAVQYILKKNKLTVDETKVLS